MGGPCDQLVPVAILYANPQGLTLRQFQNQLKRIIPKNRGYYQILSYVNEKEYGLARLLNLNETQKYKNLKKEFWEDDFKYNKEIFIPNFFKPYTEVITKSHKLINEKIPFDVTFHNSFKNEGYKLGQYIDTTFMDIPLKYENKNIEFQITDILKTKLDKETREDYLEAYEIKQKVITRAVKFNTKYERFASIKSLKQKYPYYSPEEIYDFSQENGFLYPNSSSTDSFSYGREGKCFMWKRKDNKYFLDVNYMLNNLSPNSIYPTDAKWHWSGSAQSEADNWKHNEKSKGQIYSFTDLILTCEAIRRGNSEILSHDGFRHGFLDFVYGDRKTLAVYEKAILDNEHSQIAKRNNLTNFEFLREHIFAMNKINSVSYEDKVKYSRIQKEIHDAEHRKWIEENKHLFERKDAFEDMNRDELPF